MRRSERRRGNTFIALFATFIKRMRVIADEKKSSGYQGMTAASTSPANALRTPSIAVHVLAPCRCNKYAGSL